MFEFKIEDESNMRRQKNPGLIWIQDHHTFGGFDKPMLMPLL